MYCTISRLLFLFLLPFWASSSKRKLFIKYFVAESHYTFARNLLLFFRILFRVHFFSFAIFFLIRANFRMADFFSIVGPSTSTSSLFFLFHFLPLLFIVASKLRQYKINQSRAQDNDGRNFARMYKDARHRDVDVRTSTAVCCAFCHVVVCAKYFLIKFYYIWTKYTAIAPHSSSAKVFVDRKMVYFVVVGDVVAYGLVQVQEEEEKHHFFWYWQQCLEKIYIVQRL